MLTRISWFNSNSSRLKPPLYFGGLTLVFFLFGRERVQITDLPIGKLKFTFDNMFGLSYADNSYNSFCSN